MSLFTFPAQAVSIPGAATEATLLLVEQNTANTVNELQDVNSELNTQTTSLNSIDSKLPSNLTVSSTRLLVDGSGVTQPISATSLPLPTGAATEATLATVATEATLNSILSDTSSLDSKLPANLTVTSTRLLVDGSGVTQPISAASLPLPTGAATAANQSTANASLASIDTKLTSPLSVTGPLTDAELRASAVPVSAASLPLPTGAATEATLATLATEATLSSVDSKIPANLTVTSTRLLVDGSGVTQPVSASSLPLPTGAATEATLASIEASLSLDVVDQIDTTPLLNVSSTNIPASAASPLEVVASSAATIRKVISVEDIGEFIGLYTGPASSEVLKCVLPLGGGEIELQIASGTRISIRNMKNATITSGFISLNFLG